MKIALISDFAKTLTASTNPTTWSVFAKSGLLGPQYIEDRNQLFEQYHKHELAGNIALTKQWWGEHMKLFAKYGLNTNLMEQVVYNTEYFEPRDGLGLFFDYIEQINIDMTIISSSGISNFVEIFLNSQDINISNIKIEGNVLHVNNVGEVIGYSDRIITSLNKDDIELDTASYDVVILLGDDESDIPMSDAKQCIRIGFCNSNIPGYDYYLGRKASLLEVVTLLEKIL